MDDIMINYGIMFLDLDGLKPTEINEKLHKFNFYMLRIASYCLPTYVLYIRTQYDISILDTRIFVSKLLFMMNTVLKNMTYIWYGPSLDNHPLLAKWNSTPTKHHWGLNCVFCSYFVKYGWGIRMKNTLLLLVCKLLFVTNYHSQYPRY